MRTFLYFLIVTLLFSTLIQYILDAPTVFFRHSVASNTLVPEVFLDHDTSPHERAAREPRSGEKEKTSGYFGLESHFHADASCQTRQFDNSKRDQWKLSNHVLISR